MLYREVMHTIFNAKLYFYFMTIVIICLIVIWGKCKCTPFKVGSVLFAPSHLLSMLTIGSNVGLVMDVGYQETLVVPVSFLKNHVWLFCSGRMSVCLK